ncbi:MAG: TIGR02285 family protein [Pseudomonadales bacterium]
MRKLIRQLTFSLCVLTSCSSLCNAEQQEIIHWARYEMPPFYIHTQSLRNQGIADQLFSLLQRNLPQYEHRTYTASVPRIFRSFAEDKILCTGFTKMKGREQLMHYSEPALLLSSHHLIYLKKNRDTLMTQFPLLAGQHVSLNALIEQMRSGQLAVKPSRSYGAPLNPHLKEHAAKLSEFQVSDSLPEVVKKMQKRRFDFILEYPIAITYQLQQAGITEELESIALNENSELLYAYVTCSRNPRSAKAIGAINRVISQYRATPHYRSLVERWLPADKIEQYRKNYQHFLK